MVMVMMMMMMMVVVMMASPSMPVFSIPLSRLYHLGLCKVMALRSESVVY